MPLGEMATVRLSNTCGYDDQTSIRIHSETWCKALGYPVAKASCRSSTYWSGSVQTRDLNERILDAALDIADTDGWESVRLWAVAKRLEIGLDQIHRYFPQKDDLAEAWFDRADRTVLKVASSPEFQALSERKRLHKALMTWFEALAPRRITREMLGYKLELGHVHLQALGVMRVSRTVQWFREAAGLESVGARRIGEELVLTGIFLASFARWLSDDSAGAQGTRTFLDQLLDRADNLAKFIPFR